MAVDFTEIKELLEAQGDAWEEYKEANQNRLTNLERAIEPILTKANRPGANFVSDAQIPRAVWYDRKNNLPVHALKHNQSVAALEKKDGPTPSMGRFLRGIVCGGSAPDANELADERKALNIGSDPSGGYTVAGILASQWIDLLRARMVLSQAGVTTIPMDSKQLTLARVTADPSVQWHGENAALTAGDPTFGSVQLDAKTITCITKLSLELSQDSANIEQILESTITSAIAQAIDSCGLVGVTTDVGAAPGGIMNAAGRNKVLSIGAPVSWDWLIDAMYALAAANVPFASIGAFVGHPKIWQKMRKVKSGISGDNTSLTAPAEIADLPKLWTTAAPFTSGTTCAGIIGNWSDLLFGIRKNITVRVLNEAYMGSNLQVAILAYARCDFAPAREVSFCSAEGITV
jgi:HK97 family phage major capsid protein